jgi:malate dehydrogenase
MRDRIGIVGAGHVGTEAANELLRNGVGDCVLIDIDESPARGRALDLTHSAPLRYSASTVCGGGYDTLRGCKVVVVAAGVARRPGMSRDDLLGINLGVVRQVAERLMEHAPDAVWIMVTNPLDAMVYAAIKTSGKNRREVIGMAGMLDAARFRAAIASTLGVAAQDVQGMVLGSHGDLMVPLARFATVGGIPVADLMEPSAMEAVLQTTKNAGTELVSLLHTGSAWYAAGASVAAMVDAIIHDSRRVVCSSVLCKGEYGIDGVCVGLPVVLGERGVERVIELRLNDAERRDLAAAADHLRAMQRKVDGLLSPA